MEKKAGLAAEWIHTPPSNAKNAGLNPRLDSWTRESEGVMSNVSILSYSQLKFSYYSIPLKIVSFLGQ